MSSLPFRIVLCANWKARPPKHAITQITRKPQRVIFHHTAGHAPELGDSGESYREAVAYCRSIQNYHMDKQGWADTGQNFTITRNGYIFEGRHGSVDAVLRGKMVESAHCPGQNDQPGVEIEHIGTEGMTVIQRQAAVWLFAWICKICAIPATHIFGHRDFFATSCPGVLYTGLPQFRVDVATALKPPKIPKPKPKPAPKPAKPSFLFTVTTVTGMSRTDKLPILFRRWLVRNKIAKGEIQRLDS